MERILKIFTREYSNITQAALVLGIFALLSQVLGLFRDRFLASFVGPGGQLDAYYAAFQIPDLIFISVASLASVTVIVPFILERMPDGQNINGKAKKFVNDIFTVFFSVIVFVSVIVFFLMPKIAPLVTPGFSTELQALVIDLSRIMLLSPILLGLSNLFGAITQLFQKFFIYALSPIFYNLGIILGIVFLYPHFGIQGVAYGVIFGALMHFLIQAFASIGSGFTPRFSRKVDFQSIKRVVLVSLPRTLGISLNHIALLGIIAMASFLHSGSISIFKLSINLQSVPLALIGLSYAVAAFPAMTKSFTIGDIEKFKIHLKRTARAIIFWALPVSFLFIVLRAQIVRVILGSPEFSWDNTRLVAAALAIFSISVMAQSLISLFARAYYAAGNTKKPLAINFVSSISIIGFAFLFVYMFKSMPLFQVAFENFFKVSGIVGTEVLMLPLAYSCGTIVNFILFWLAVKKDFLKREAFIMKTFLQVILASAVMGVVSYLFLNILSPVFGTITFWGIFLQGFISGVVGIVAGVIVLRLLKNEELRDLTRALRTKFWKARVITSQEQNL